VFVDSFVLLPWAGVVRGGWPVPCLVAIVLFHRSASRRRHHGKTSISLKPISVSLSFSLFCLSATRAPHRCLSPRRQQQQQQQPAAVFGDGLRISCAKCSKLRRDPPGKRPAKACTKKERYWFCEDCVIGSPEAFVDRGICVCRPDGKWKMATVRVRPKRTEQEPRERVVFRAEERVEVRFVATSWFAWALVSAGRLEHLGTGDVVQF